MEAKEKSGGEKQYVIQVSQDSQNLQRARTAGYIQKRIISSVLNVPDTAGDLQPTFSNLCLVLQGS